MRVMLVVLILLYMCGASAAHKLPERVYQQMYCPQYMREVRLSDGSRVDCLTNNFAIEFDFASKWAEALGQSLHYARMTGRKPVIFLIMERDTDVRYVQRLMPLCKKYGVRLTLIYY